MGLRKPDLVVELGDSALIIDAQVVSEQTNLEEANVRKKAKYDTAELKNMVRRKYGKQEVTTSAVTISMRGIWSRTSAAELREKRIISGMDIWVISSRVVIGTLACWHCHQASTEMALRRRGIG